jgi:polyphosphate kinase
MATLKCFTGKGFLNLLDPQYYISREVSWLEFNRRVLHEALDERTPLLEGLKLLGIFSSNLDEFFMVRVAGIKQQIMANVNKMTPDGRTPSEQLQAISATLRPMVSQQQAGFEKHLRPHMVNAGIYLLNYGELTAAQTQYLKQYFEDQIAPVLTPLAVDPGRPFPYISNLSLNLAVLVKDPASQQEHFARVKVPKVLPRFLPLPKDLHGPAADCPCEWVGVPLEQVIADNLAYLFPGMVVEQHYLFRITRNADLAVEEDEADDLMLAIEQELRKRRLGGSAVRMEIESTAPTAIRTMLMQEMDLEEADVYDLDGLLGLSDLMSFLALPLPDLKARSWTPMVPPAMALLPAPKNG